MIVIRLSVLAVCCCLSQAANWENMRLFERLGLGRTVGDHAPSIRTMKTPGNSPMFVIKLPPSPYYYLNHVSEEKPATPRPHFPRVPVSFLNNGKPDRLYHYNLGLVTPDVDEVDATPSTTTTTTPPTTTTTPSTTTSATTTPRPAKVSAKERLRQKYAAYYKASRPPMKKYRYASNGRPSSFYVMRGSGDRKPVYFRRFV